METLTRFARASDGLQPSACSARPQGRMGGRAGAAPVISWFTARCSTVELPSPCLVPPPGFEPGPPRLEDACASIYATAADELQIVDSQAQSTIYLVRVYGFEPQSRGPKPRGLPLADTRMDWSGRWESHP